MSSDGDDAEPKPKAVLGHRPSHIPRTVAVAIVLGAFGGLVTVVFVRAMDGLKELLWTTMPDRLGVDPTAWFFIFPVVLVGAVLLGFARHHLGEYPVSIEQALVDHKRNGEFDHRHIGQALVISLISLVFGAALGPEAALMAILGGISSWVARVIDANTEEGTDISFVGISSALGALFGVGAAALTLDPRASDADDVRSGRIWRIIPSLAAAWAGVFVFSHLGTSDHYFDLGLPAYSFTGSDLAWALPVMVVSTIVGLVFLAACRGTDRLLAPLAGHAILESVAGGVGLALLASFSSLILFSGHEGVDTLIADYGNDSSRFLVLVAIGKLLAAALLLSAKWKGGKFFPLMFVGAALGLAMSQQLTSVAEVPAIAAGMTAVVAVLIKRPLAAAIFMVLFFPPAAWPIVVVAAVIGGVAGKRIGTRIEGADAAEEAPAATA